MSASLWLGLGAALLWILVLAVSSVRPERRLWPPRNGNLLTALSAWILTILIYVGLFRTVSADWNAGGLPATLRWGIGGPVSLLGSICHSWGTFDLGLKGTSGWPVGLRTTGAYGIRRHPQYLGQILMLAGIALIAGTQAGWWIVLAGSTALVYAARVEDAHLSAREPGFASYAGRVRFFV